jgi:glycosyltransferase involved in cell wall biosynthesis
MIEKAQRHIEIRKWLPKYAPSRKNRSWTLGALFVCVVLTVIVSKTADQHVRISYPTTTKPNHDCKLERKLPPYYCAAVTPGIRSTIRHGLANNYFRIFWPDHAKFMVLPGDHRRTGTRCASRVIDDVHTIIVTLVTELWNDVDVWRLKAMIRALQNQSYRVTNWWVLFVAADSKPHRNYRKTLRTLRQNGAHVIFGNGQDLVRSIRSSSLHSMPSNVLITEDFNAILEHAAVEKFVWALEAQQADAVSSSSVVFDQNSKQQHFFTRTGQHHHGTFIFRAASADFWRAIEMAVHPSDHRLLVTQLLCDHRVKVHILPEFLVWEDGQQKSTPLAPSGNLDCFAWNQDRNGSQSTAPFVWRKLARSGAEKSPNECAHRASFVLIVPWLEYGGADQFNVNLVRNLATPHNIHVVVITTTAGSTHPLFGDIAAVTEDVFHLDNLLLPAWRQPPGSLNLLDAVTYLANTRSADVVMISNSEPAYQNLPMLKPRLPNVVFVDYVHSVALEWRNGGYGRYSIENQQWLDHTLVSSNKLKAWFESEGHAGVDAYGRPLLHVVYVGVDTGECRRLSRRERRSIRQRYGIDLVRPMIVFPARMSPEKNPGRFFAIVHRLITDHPDVTVVAVGGGPLLEALRANITRAGLSNNIITTGALAHQDTLRVMQSADMMMLTSDYEGISLSIFEGMSVGLVPFSTDVGAQGELATPDTGFLIPLDENVVNAYANALHALLDDPKTISKMQLKSHARVSKGFDVAQVPLKMHEAMC